MDRLRDPATATITSLVALPLMIALASFGFGGLLWGAEQYAWANTLFAIGSLTTLVAVGILLVLLGPWLQVRLTIELARSQQSHPTLREFDVLLVRGRRVDQGYGRVRRAFYTSEATVNAKVDLHSGVIREWDEATLAPIYTPIWSGHDTYLRWAQQAANERHSTFQSEGVLELAVDTWSNGQEIAFLAAVSDNAEQAYKLHPGHEYLFEIEIGADNASPQLRYYRASLSRSHLEAGVIGRQRLEIVEISLEDFEQTILRAAGEGIDA